MSLTGYLAEYSLVEIFNFVQAGHKTGLLSIQADRCLSRSLNNAYSISFQSGRIMSVSGGNELADRGLLKMMAQRQWLSTEQITGLSFHASNLGQPLGTHLKSCNLLDSSQLNLLFNAQVVAGICKLFEEHHYGSFSFDPQATLSYPEMTGISLPINEVALMGLRMLRDWNSFAAKLPAPEAGLQRFSAAAPTIRLDAQESKVWNLALGDLSIAQIATQLNLTVEKVQQVGYRLMAIGLVQDVSIDPPQPPVNKMMDLPQLVVTNGVNNTPVVSASFLGNLMSFLKKKG
jgi:DNA-binding CsgD family transcriptional regulator